jgi:4-hydroxy-tetrahydrodipicolinate synthase|tara:strand:- start:168 stop:1052 length:885 start_codon:yes stop_codon:yes gene_type:complete
MSIIHGCITALITPFKANGKLDEIGLENLILRQIENGVHGIVPCGTTGESPTLTHEEHQEVIKISIDVTKKKIPVIAGTGSNSTNEALEMTASAEEAGANATLQVVPYYNKPNQEGLFKHFSEISKHTSLPLILYNIPGRSIVNLEVGTIKKLATENKNIVGIKEASGDINIVKEIKLVCPKDFIVLSGEDSLNLSILEEGGSGFISVTSNLIPNKCSQLFNLFKDGNILEARKINSAISELNKLLFIDTNPIPIKSAMSKIGLCQNNLRLPLTSLSKEKTILLYEELKKMNLI